MNQTSNRPMLLGLFQKRIEGDDALLELARLRYEQAELGAETYASSPEELEGLLLFRPRNEQPVVVHLPRNLDLLQEWPRRRIQEFAQRFSGRVRGFVVHDQPEMAQRTEDYADAVQTLDSTLPGDENCPWIFIEYAAGLEPDDFVDFFEDIRASRRISACIDTGHVGIWQTRKSFSKKHPGADVCSFKPDTSNLLKIIEDVQSAVASALPTVLTCIRRLAALRKPLHFHLHDGHPLSTFSPYGVSDHLSFLSAIPIGFAYKGERSLPLMFGQAGLSQIVSAATAPDLNLASLTLEIHPTIQDRRPLADAEFLFQHWRDKRNAERMSHWVGLIVENARLVHEMRKSAQAQRDGATTER